MEASHCVSGEHLIGDMGAYRLQTLEYPRCRRQVSTTYIAILRTTSYLFLLGGRATGSTVSETGLLDAQVATHHHCGDKSFLGPDYQNTSVPDLQNDLRYALNETRRIENLK